MDFQSADRSNDAGYTVSLNDYNKNVELYNKQRTKDLLGDKLNSEGLEAGAQSDANTGALKDAGQHATALAQGVATAKNVKALGTPIKATKDIVVGGGDTAKFVKAGEITGEETAQTLGKSAGKVSSALGVIGDIGSIGMDIAQDKANWGTMSTADKIANVADMGGAGLDMVGTGLMTFGGPVGAGIGLGLKAFGDLVEIGAGTESAVSGYESASAKQAKLKQQEQQAEADEGKAQVKTQASATLAGAGNLAVGRTSQY